MDNHKTPLSSRWKHPALKNHLAGLGLFASRFQARCSRFECGCGSGHCPIEDLLEERFLVPADCDYWNLSEERYHRMHMPLTVAKRIGKHYVNPVATKVGGFSTIFKVGPRFFFGRAGRSPKHQLGPFRTDHLVYR